MGEVSRFGFQQHEGGAKGHSLRWNPEARRLWKMGRMWQVKLPGLVCEGVAKGQPQARRFCQNGQAPQSISSWAFTWCFGVAGVLRFCEAQSTTRSVSSDHAARNFWAGMKPMGNGRSLFLFFFGGDELLKANRPVDNLVFSWPSFAWYSLMALSGLP